MDILQPTLIPLRIREPSTVEQAVERIYVEVLEIMVPSRERVVAHDGEADVRVDQSDEALNVTVEVAEGLVDVGLGGVGAVQARVLEVEAVDFDQLVAVIWICCWGLFGEEVVLCCGCCFSSDYR